jgi:hypothetical protein
MKNIIHTIARFLNGLQRPSKRSNLRRLYKRGETPAAFTIREATAADIPALASLHVQTWNETHGHARHPPTARLREHQWQEQFGITDGSWFCFVAENQRGDLIGFAKGIKY